MAITHQKFAGNGYFGRVINLIAEGQSSVGSWMEALKKNSFKVRR
jgi:hypothetical protein